MVATFCSSVFFLRGLLDLAAVGIRSRWCPRIRNLEAYRSTSGGSTVRLLKPHSGVSSHCCLSTEVCSRTVRKSTDFRVGNRPEEVDTRKAPIIRRSFAVGGDTNHASLGIARRGLGFATLLE